MNGFLTTIILGIILSVLGITNMKGNINSLHRYHRHRVTEADRKPFGRLVGEGHLIVGLACIVSGLLFLIFEKTQMVFFVIAGIVITIAGFVVGLIIIFYAMIKYNKGIF